MLYLATGAAVTKDHGDGLILSIPNGENSTVEIALTLHQALHISHRIQKDAHRLLDNQPDAPTGELIAFPSEVPSLVVRELRITRILKDAQLVADSGRAEA